MSLDEEQGSSHLLPPHQITLTGALLDRITLSCFSAIAVSGCALVASHSNTHFFKAHTVVLSEGLLLLAMGAFMAAVFKQHLRRRNLSLLLGQALLPCPQLHPSWDYSTAYASTVGLFFLLYGGLLVVSSSLAEDGVRALMEGGCSVLLGFTTLVVVGQCSYSRGVYAEVVPADDPFYVVFSEVWPLFLGCYGLLTLIFLD